MHQARRLLPVALLVALPFAFHWKLFSPDLGERTIFRGDFLNQHFAWKSYTLSRVASGELPLWNPHVLGGVAIHANPQAGIFYPPSYLLLPFVEDGRVNYLALEAFQLLHQVFAGLGMWLLMRALSIRNPGALLAAIVFMFTGFFTTPGHHAIIVTASWLPWALYAVQRAREHTSAARASVMMSLVFGGLILGGHPQVAYYCLLLAAGFAAWTMGLRQASIRFAPAAVIGLGLSAVQFLPTFQLAEASSRAALGYEYSSSFGLSPYFLTSWFVPRGQVPLPGQEAAAPLHFFTGVGTLLFAAIGLTLSSDRRRLFFASSAALALFLSFGRDSPLFDWFYAALPGFGRFRVPYRLLGIYGASMAVLAGFGLQVLRDAKGKTRRRIRSICWTALFVLLLFAAWAAALHTSVTRPGALPPDQLDRLVGGAYWAVLIGALHLSLLVIWLWRPAERWAIPMMIVVSTLDIASFVKDRGEHPYETLQRSGERFVHRLVRAQGESSRHASESNLENYSMLHGTRFVGGHAALVDAHYAGLMELSRGSANALSLLNAKFIARGGEPSRYPWCGTRYQSPFPLLDVPPELSPARIGVWPPVTTRSLRVSWSPLGAGGGGAFEVVGKTYPLVPGVPVEVRFDEEQIVDSFRIVLDSNGAGVRLEDIELDLNPIALKADFLILDGIKINLHTLPRAYFMEPSAVPRERQTLEGLTCWTIYDGVQVENLSTGEGASGAFRRNTARILSEAPERIVIETSSPRDGFLVLSDTYRPGWLAFVDGEPETVWRAQWSMRAVPVPAGAHEVVFEYQPSSLKVGSRITAISMLALGLLWLYPRFRRREDPEPLSPDEDFSTEL